MELSLEMLEELRRCVNTMISSRIEYKYIENSELRIEKNNKYIQLDYRLLEVILKEIESMKKQEQC